MTERDKTTTWTNREGHICYLKPCVYIHVPVDFQVGFCLSIFISSLPDSWLLPSYHHWVNPTFSVDPFINGENSLCVWCSIVRLWDGIPLVPLVGIFLLRAKGSESSSWANKPTNSPVTGVVIAKPVSPLFWMDPVVPSGLFQWERMGGESVWEQGNRVEFSQSL